MSQFPYYENDDDCDFPSIEQLLYTTLQKEGFAAEGQCPNNTVCGVRDVTVEEGGGSLNQRLQYPFLSLSFLFLPVPSLAFPGITLDYPSCS
jgi:hypothetical protein